MTGNAGRRLRLDRRLYGTEREYSKRPYGVVLTTINPNRDQMTFDGPRAGRTIPVSHPYLGPTSWIRVMPERSTRMIINARCDSGEPFVAAYIAEDSSADRITSTYERNAFYYRRLREGEISIASPGVAEQHFALGGTMSLRAGPLTQVMNVEKLEITSKAPTVITRALDHVANKISSEIRFGVVKRVNAQDATQDRFIKIVPEGTGSEVFAKEYLRNVRSSVTPFNLVDHREGHVIDDRGEEETSRVTGKKLRSRTRWGTASEDASEDESSDDRGAAEEVAASEARNAALAEVDVDGNINVKLPRGASYGFNLEVEETDATVIVGRDEVHNVGRNLMFDVAQRLNVEANDLVLASASGGGIGISSSGTVSLGATDGVLDSEGRIVRGGALNDSWTAILIPDYLTIPAPTTAEPALLPIANRQAIQDLITALSGALSNISSTT